MCQKCAALELLQPVTPFNLHSARPRTNVRNTVQTAAFSIYTNKIREFCWLFFSPQIAYSLYSRLQKYVPEMVLWGESGGRDGLQLAV